MNILYHHRTSGEEPESVHILNIVRALRALGHEVDIEGPVALTKADRPAKSSALGGLKRRLPRMLVEVLLIIFNGKSAAQLCAALRRRRYEFIYERYALYNFAGLAAARLFKLPIILEVNTLYAQAWRQYFGLSFPRLARRMERYVFRHASHLITVTEVQRRMLEREGVHPDRISVCHNAIDPEEFSPQRFANDGLRRELGLRPIVVGFVGTMNRWQGVHGFVDVVREVAAVRDDVSFLFVGDGEGRGRLREELGRLRLLDYAVFAGRQPHDAVPRFVAAMDIGVLLDSNVYGSPMKIFEYWCLQKAVVAPSVPPVCEILTDGIDGLLIEPGDAAGMARQIIKLCEDPEQRLRLGAAGRQTALERHTWAQNARRIIEVFEDCRRKDPR